MKQEGVKTVREIMCSPVITVGLDDTLEVVKAILERNHIHHVVVRSEGRVMGVVSDRDVLRALSPFIGKEWAERKQDLQTLRRRVHQIMRRHPIVIEPEADLREAASLLMREDVSCLPVVESDGRLVGIVTSKDLLAAAFGLERPVKDFAETSKERHQATNNEN